MNGAEEVKEILDIKPFLAPRMKHQFDNNESGWLFMYNYFRQFLPNLLVSHALKSSVPPSVVFDIDHTVLQYQTPLFQTPLIFSNSTPNSAISVSPKELRVTSPIALELYKMFLANGLPIYFVTARPQSTTNARVTEYELTALGFGGYRQIYYMPSINDNVGLYKQRIRNALKPILFNVGDQWTDMFNYSIDDLYEKHCYIMNNLEPDCEWALKLIPYRERIQSFSPTLSSTLSSPSSIFSSYHPFHSRTNSKNSILNSVFETISPYTESEICEHCGYLQQYH